MMAEAKYDLLLIPTKTDKRIYEQPWYKERLRTRYIKSLGPNDTSKFLDGHSWTFVKDGLDDFRDGLPPLVEGEEVLKGLKGLRPNVTGSSDNLSSVKQPAVPNRFTKDQVCYSRATPQQQQRRDHIDDVEYGLKQHPLALYPHLEECMPPDVFEDVVDILDPEMNLASEEDDDSYRDNEEDDAEPQNQFPDAPAHHMQLPQDNLEGDGDQKPVKNPYRWLPKKEEKEKKDKKKGERRSPSPSQDEHIKGVAKDFCDWVADLGGETNNIEESTIMSLFASGYETKPALSVPIHVVELTNVPAELRMSANVPQQPSKPANNIPPSSEVAEEWTHSGSYQPSWMKFRYGAWYLSPNEWRKMRADEPLQDPKDLKDKELSDAKKKSTNLDSQLAPMHGAKAFMDFIEKKGTRRPEFLNRVREIKKETDKEEAVRMEAELMAKKKLENMKDF